MRKHRRPRHSGLDLIRQRSAQVLAPARLAADLGGRAVRPGGPMAGAWSPRCAAYGRNARKVGGTFLGRLGSTLINRGLIEPPRAPRHPEPAVICARSSSVTGRWPK